MRDWTVLSLFLGGYLMFLGIAILPNSFAVFLFIVGAAIFAVSVPLRGEEGEAVE